MQARVLIVEDDAAIASLVAYHLERAGFHALSLANGAEAMRQFDALRPDIVLLDVMLPERDGLEICRWIRARSATPIILVTARAEEVDRILGLEMGADDYVSKPFSPRELVARVKAVLRRTEGEGMARPFLHAGALTIDIGAHEVRTEDGRALPVTATEFSLLTCLAEHRNLAVSRDTLLDRIWGTNFYGDTRTIDVHIRHLREKLEQHGVAPNLIETVRGVGYRLRDGE